MAGMVLTCEKRSPSRLPRIAPRPWFPLSTRLPSAGTLPSTFTLFFSEKRVCRGFYGVLSGTRTKVKSGLPNPTQVASIPHISKGPSVTDLCSSFPIPALHPLNLMTPYFIRNLVPRKRAHNKPSRPLSHVLGELTFIQWLQFSSGYKASPTIRLAETDLGGAVDGWLGLAMRSISSMSRSASLPWGLNSTKTLPPSSVSPSYLCFPSLMVYETSDDGYYFDSSRPIYRRCKYIFNSLKLRTVGPLLGVYFDLWYLSSCYNDGPQLNITAE